MRRLVDSRDWQEELDLQRLALRLTTCVRSCVGILIDYWCPTLKDLVAPVLLLLQLGQSVLGAHNWLVLTIVYVSGNWIEEASVPWWVLTILYTLLITYGLFGCG